MSEMILKNKFVAIVPTFNMQSYIVDCLQSILDQDYSDIGILIQDNASTDDTPHIIREFLDINDVSDAIFIETNNIDENSVQSAMKHIHPESVVGVIDGDDFIVKPWSVSGLIEKLSRLDTKDGVVKRVGRDYDRRDDMWHFSSNIRVAWYGGPPYGRWGKSTGTAAWQSLRSQGFNSRADMRYREPSR